MSIVIITHISFYASIIISATKNLHNENIKLINVDINLTNAW